MEEIVSEYMNQEAKIVLERKALEESRKRLNEIAEKFEDWLEENNESATGFLTLNDRLFEYELERSSSDSSYRRIALKRVRTCRRLNEIAEDFEDWLEENNESATDFVASCGRFFEYELACSLCNSKGDYKIHYKIHLKEIHVLEQTCSIG